MYWKYTLITKSCWLQTSLLIVEGWLQGDKYEGLDFLKGETGSHNKLILYMNSKHKNRNNYCLIYCRKLNIKTQIFESENNFCIENIPWLQRVVDYKQACW